MKKVTLSSILMFLAVGCASTPSTDNAFVKAFDADGKADTSAEAVFLNFTFDGELLATSSWNPERHIESQLLYTIGHLNGDDAVGRLDNVELSNVDVQPEGNAYRIKYTATVPVAWRRSQGIPTEYTFHLPLDISSTALDSFADSHGTTCVDFGAHDVDSGSMWYYYRPNRGNCQLPEGEIISIVAGVELSDINTTGKFPEYDKVWEDDALKVVAVFGKYKDDATSDSDAGISAYNRFASEIARRLSDYNLTTIPSSVPRNPGVEMPDITYSATLPDGKQIEVITLLVDNVRTAGPTFNDRYAELTPEADLIFYNGHAGLGSNIRALAQKGSWEEGQYAIVFMNGCDTYAYVDSALWDAHAEINADDPEGTKYLDLISNALPSYFRSMPAATLALVEGLIDHENPQTYEQIFADIDRQQIVLVSGEQDNTYTPGGGGTTDPAWPGLVENGSLSSGENLRFETPTLPAGDYIFEMTGTGDNDLYVRIGSEPDARRYDCRPYRSDSNEVCQVSLPSASTIHVMVDGYTGGDFSLNGTPQ